MITARSCKFTFLRWTNLFLANQTFFKQFYLHEKIREMKLTNKSGVDQFDLCCSNSSGYMRRRRIHCIRGCGERSFAAESGEWPGHQRRNKKTSRTPDVGARTTRKELQITRIVSESCLAGLAPAIREATLNKAARRCPSDESNGLTSKHTVCTVGERNHKDSRDHTASHVPCVDFVLDFLPFEVITRSADCLGTRMLFTFS